MQNKWQTLQAGDSVRIVAPGAKIHTAWDDLQKCCAFLKSLNLNPLYSDRIFFDNPGYYHFANTAEERYQDFLDAVESDVKVIWCYRGGYGSDRVTELLVANNIKAPVSPKLLVGFSDVTNLHSYLNRQWKWPTLHACGIRLLALNEVDELDAEKTLGILFGKYPESHLTLIPMNTLAKKNSAIEASVVGGNLTTLQCAIGTPWETNTDNTILLLEDVGEAPYRIARMLRQFLTSDYLKKSQAILLGDFTPGNAAQEVLQEFADACPLPVLRCEGVGHERVNHPVPLGTKAFLTLGINPFLVVTTGCRA